MLTGYDVLDLEAQETNGLRQKAVFAPLLGAGSNGQDHIRVHQWARSGLERSFGLKPKDGQQAIDTKILVEFITFLGR